ncbi:MAG: four helix bundle protein [Saprospiraceae bacterium]|nr:four helix bundle protein [Saprospiraceae bacterium]MBK8449052.1 four helix bundle protein [Saprospiraceae bacterium]MBK8484887.1 four helix bundle protein [Saprospiraceae bacterium]MBK9223291.1 four helix bundle protein [Saprospiraceae bacterium]MBK9720823.1 four helix bundle protein [Saprospiraceae bacterium]
MFNDELRERTFNFAINTIKLLRQIPDNQESKTLKNQIIRSATSIASNFRASCVSRSQREWFSKICIVIEETDETHFWIELFEQLYPENLEGLSLLKSESFELLKIFSKSRGKLPIK